MKLSEIQELIKFVAKSGVSEVELEQKDFKISIVANPKPKKGAKQEPVYVQQPQHIQAVVPAQAPAPAPAPAAAPAASPAPAAPAAESKEAADDDKYVTIKAQMIGTFYRKPNPDADPFVEVGDTIKEGQEICIIEAMKLYNKIESEISGKIVKVLVDDSSPVEFDQPLFLVDPS
ncbi:acetyl-CoA carboxylase biotin carboxyl carrier protein [Parvicella tangerina]|uniref:Biotin carboxyl carrier protein of acetyl-CoA carboxylase n=1 Tax=Parvicella tangerina TaxID=2829795 RepID=A0A916NJ95_9FLAO|nr:acetyl-CoA carboxylase biotin carboxyl carrier protein [Parvicella tangerina]CAG5086498.1 Biotin carboxyl carrier protein of acetyl-CoA carboxylase [Parvicella tangerina]